MVSFTIYQAVSDVQAAFAQPGDPALGFSVSQAEDDPAFGFSSFLKQNVEGYFVLFSVN